MQAQSSSTEWQAICTDAILQGERICQIPFELDGSYVCGPCANSCLAMAEKRPKLTGNYFLPFQCQCQLICMRKGHSCSYALQRQTQPELAAKFDSCREALRREMPAHIETSMKPAVPENYGNQNAFFAKVNGQVQSCEQYEDDFTQCMALSVIPESIVGIGSANQVQQLKALLAWYKQDFFKWQDKPACENCQPADPSKVISQGMGNPTPEEVEGGARRVEIYFCTGCNMPLRYPRYNQVIKLVETRRGRCGEWANCFTAMVRALGHEARFVVDWTDHVWTEAFIESESRWVHMDPCENAYDAPKMYERGWGKKLTYIVAVSAREVVDVTPRYIVNQSMNRMRRTLVSDDWLKNMLAMIRKRLLFGQSDETVVLFSTRLEAEMKELADEASKVSPSTIQFNQAEVAPRSTGSLEWRLQRGEMGQSASAQAAQQQERPGSAAAVQQLMERQQIASARRVAEYDQSRPDEEVYQEKLDQESQLMSLVAQLETGCGQAGCGNSASCATANPSLKETARAKAITKALDLMREKVAVKCTQ